MTASSYLLDMLFETCHVCEFRVLFCGLYSSRFKQQKQSSVHFHLEQGSTLAIPSLFGSSLSLTTFKNPFLVCNQTNPIHTVSSSLLGIGKVSNYC